jgi:hypothetical protein
MKWFQMDADTPSDPRIRAVLARFGNAGLGALLRLWCFVADHGNKPGVSIDSQGKPFPTATLVEATGLTPRTYRDLMTALADSGHIQKSPFRKSGLIVIPAMSKRASNYEKYQRRRHDNDASSKRRKQDSTVQDSTYNARGRAGERGSPGPAARSGTHCAHDPRCDTFTACIQRTITEARAERHAEKRES